MDALELVDRVRRRTIVALSSDDTLMERLELKGGNALEVVYGIATRASFDLDYSIDGAFDDLEWLSRTVERVIAESFREIDLVAFDISMSKRPPMLSDDLKGFWGGCLIEFKLIDVEKFRRFAMDIDSLRRYSLSVGPGGSTKYTVDISHHEHCADRRPFLIDGHSILVYSPASIVCEKLRAICQQMPDYAPVVKRSCPGTVRARDFVGCHGADQMQPVGGETSAAGVNGAS